MKGLSVKVAACAVSVLCLGRACAAGEDAVADTDVWNEAVGFYQSGDVTNALRLLRPLMVSRRYSARASEVVAKIEHERGNREEAALAAQAALRLRPSDERTQRNFTRAVDGLGEFSRLRRIEAALKESKGKDPSSLLLSAVKESRRLMGEAGTYRTNDAVRAVALSDSLSAAAEKLSDVWLQTREQVVSCVTNEEQRAAAVAAMEQSRSKTRLAAKLLADIDPGACRELAAVEHEFTRFLKAVIAPPQAIEEALMSQSNAYLDVENFNGRDWQKDSLDYTRSFRSKFPAWAEEYVRRAQSDTNMPPFSAEDRARISALAEELEKTQVLCAGKHLPPEQEKAMRILTEIKDLLPEEKNGGGGGGDGQSGGRPPDASKPPQKPDAGENEDEGDHGRQTEDPDEKTGEEPGEEEKPDRQEEDDDREVESVLRRAQERNDEYEDEKKARMRKSPPFPNERDW